MKSGFTAALLAITLTLGCVGVAGAQAPNLAQANAVDPFDAANDAAKAAIKNKDYSTAISLWRSLADKGYWKGQYNLGVMYESGLGVAQDYKEAARLYRLAAAQGDAKAQTNLGGMYANGQGVARDNVRAHMWCNLGAISGESKKASTYREIVAAKMSPPQIAEAQEMGRKCQASNFKQCD